MPAVTRKLSAAGVAAGALALVLVLVLASCGKATTATATTSGTGSGGPATPAGVTVASAAVGSVGSVLVNGQGLTLYILTSEQGGHLTCTDANGCTRVWPDTELPAGVTSATAGAGVDASRLGTVKDSSGNLIVTYAGFPLYTFAHDSGPGTANGQGIKSFGGTWETMAPSGTPVPATTDTTDTTVYKY